MQNLLNGISGLDYRIVLWMQNSLRNGAADPFWELITLLGNMGLIWLILDAVFLFRKSTRRAGAACILSIVISALVGNFVLKAVFLRPRPFMAHHDIYALVQETGYSFPSCHTLASFANAMVIYKRIGRREGAAAFVLASLIGFSRVFVAVHYPSDVICGMLAGLLIGQIVSRAAFKLKQKKAISIQKGMPQNS